MNEIEAIRLMVMSYLGYGVLKVGKAPIDATYEVVKERSKRRLEWVIDNATRKKGGTAFKVSDRVAFKAMTEAAFTDDSITADYLGGVLAASGPADDSGAPVVALIGRLSADQLRLHYLVYRELARLWPPNASLNLYQEVEANKAGLRLPVEDLIAALGETGLKRLAGSVKVLIREGLLGENHKSGIETVDGTTTWNLRVRPSALGAELFMWGRGAADVQANALFTSGAMRDTEVDVPETPMASLLSPPQPSEPKT